MIDFLPAPLGRPSAQAIRPDGSHEEIQLWEEGALVALAFKVQLWGGRRHVFARIYRRRLNSGDMVEFIAADCKVRKEHIARLFEVDAGKKVRLDVALPGPIVLIAGLRFASTGDTLCAPGRLVSLEGIETRRPVPSLAIEPGAGTDEEALLEVLDKQQQVRLNSLTVTEDAETDQQLPSGMGELHLQIVLERLERGAGERIEDRAVIRPEVDMPEGNLGAALGDLQSRRALIRDIEVQMKTVTIGCEVGLESLLGYTTDLRSQNQGRGWT